MELRTRLRYQLSVSSTFSWEGVGSNRMFGDGVSRDISIAGVYIFTSMCPPVGARVQLEIFVCPTADAPWKALRIKTGATVLRVEHQVNGSGFAAGDLDLELFFDRHQSFWE